ncbi:MAG: hypothetical protein LBK58_10005 [Prevotellaceae bacterium]|jgi:hypothetical protein|nr:hypothetical protein [Prevotellaceae bacterium]
MDNDFNLEWKDLSEGILILIPVKDRILQYSMYCGQAAMTDCKGNFLFFIP